MLQIKKRKDGNRKWRFMATICFYQDSRHDKPLRWIRNLIGIGYISHRNDGMTELRINGFSNVTMILKTLMPYIKFKNFQAKAMYRATQLLSGKKIEQLTKSELIRLANWMLQVQNHNYVARRKKTKEEIYSILGVTP